MDRLIKFNNQTAGRDKFFRLFQYSSRLIWASLEDKTASVDLKKKLKDLEYTLSTGRKLYRFGRGVDTLYTALSTLHLRDPTLRYTITFSKINMALYLLTDHIIWLERAGLLNIDKVKWSRLSYKLWLFALIMNLSRDFYEIKQILRKLSYGGLSQELQFKSSQPSNTIVSKLNLYYKVLALHKDVLVDLVKNGCDVCIPLAQLGHLSISPRTVGLLGVISSAAGILPLLDSSFKLPS